MISKNSENSWTESELNKLIQYTKKYGIEWFNKNYTLNRKPKEYLFWARPGGFLEQLTLTGDTIKSLGPYRSETIYSIFSSPDRQTLWMISNCYKTRSSKLREYRIESDDFYERLEWIDPKIEEAQLGVISLDGNHLFIAHKDGFLRKWSSKRREIVKEYKHKKEFSWVECLSLTQDGEFILFGARNQDRYILRKCSTKNLKAIADYYLNSKVKGILSRIIPVGQDFILEENDKGHIGKYQTNTCEVKEFEKLSHMEWDYQIAFTLDFKTMLAVNKGRVDMYSTISCKIIGNFLKFKDFDRSKGLLQLEFSNCGRWLY